MFEQPHIHFQLPVNLKEGVTIRKFHTSATEQQYLVRTGDRRFQINRSLYNLLTLIDGRRELEKLAGIYSQRETKAYSSRDIINIINQYLVPRGIVATGDRVVQTTRQKSCLLFRIPLLKAEWIQPLVSLLKPLFKPLLFVSLSGISSIVLSYIFLTLDSDFFNALAESPVYFLSLYGFSLLSTLFHELGHAAACHTYGARHGEIGFGLYLYFPVFYANVSDVWKLTRRQRVMVDFAGIYFQLIFNLVLFAIYLASGNTLFLYPLYFIGIQIVFSLNPFFRFDGYWLASDILGIPNLRRHSFGLLSYLFKKQPQSFINNLPRQARIAFILYAGLSNLFFLFVFYRLFVFIPDMLTGYPTLMSTGFSAIKNSLLTHNWIQVGVLVYQILFKTLIILIMGSFLLRMIKSVISLLRQLVHNFLKKYIQ